ncbi:ubiquinone anaerobic biosynthesis protein UbiV [Pinisolibacter sp.]|uniref:ubiquinone anaerobic biosynthesis protein UbiV n=1 Tax=Pinisolibacter sp. TaxID=2172024 RepID=UPI002FDE3C44
MTAVTAANPTLVMGPVLYNWSVDAWVDFHARVADEIDVDRVHVGEVVCSKREPFFADRLPEVIERLQRGGKTVVVDTLALVTVKRERQLVGDLAALDGVEIEINDLTPLATLDFGRRFAVSPLVNVYNEGTLAFLASRGAWSVCLPPELPLAQVEALAREGARLGVETQVFAFGRLPLAISGRCYHARIHGLAKDSCRYVCSEDPDGLEVDTLDGEAFLAVNGVQTMSQDCAVVMDELDALVAASVGAFRLSPQTGDMGVVATAYRDRLAGRIDGAEAMARLATAGLTMPIGPSMMSRAWTPATQPGR